MVTATDTSMTVNETDISPYIQPVGPRATPVSIDNDLRPSTTPTYTDMAVSTPCSSRIISEGNGDELESTQYETLRVIHDPPSEDTGTEGQHSNDHNINDESSSMYTMMITRELLSFLPDSSYAGDVSEDSSSNNFDTNSGKEWTADDMESALEAIRSNNMSLSNAAVTFGIPSSTLWQRAQRAGIDTFKKAKSDKSWNDDTMNIALEEIRAGRISTNKASKVFGIPSSTLYKNARKGGLLQSSQNNTATIPWTQEKLEQALLAIRNGQTTVLKASADYGIPSGTLYGRCKRDKIDVSRSSTRPWSDDTMTKALESIRSGHMNITQAAVHYSLPYSSLYVRFKRVKNVAGQLDDDYDDTANQGPAE